MFNSSGGSSLKAQAGMTIIGLKKPMAAGTLTRSDVARVTGLDEFSVATVFRTVGSKSAASIFTQLRRNSRSRQSPDDKRSMAINAAATQTRNRASPQCPGTVRRGCASPVGRYELPRWVEPIKGIPATANRAISQTAKRVPEF